MLPFLSNPQLFFIEKLKEIPRSYEDCIKVADFVTFYAHGEYSVAQNKSPYIYVNVLQGIDQCHLQFMEVMNPNSPNFEEKEAKIAKNKVKELLRVEGILDLGGCDDTGGNMIEDISILFYLIPYLFDDEEFHLLLLTIAQKCFLKVLKGHLAQFEYLKKFKILLNNIILGFSTNLLNGGTQDIQNKFAYAREYIKSRLESSPLTFSISREKLFELLDNNLTAFSQKFKVSLLKLGDSTWSEYLDVFGGLSFMLAHSKWTKGEDPYLISLIIAYNRLNGT